MRGWLAPWWLHLGVLAPSVVVIALVSALAVNSVITLSAVRAYVAGESQWSKARNDAIRALRDYALSRDPADYDRFAQALSVPLGDRRAREEMMRPEPDIAAVKEGLIAGGNHPDDLDAMITLFRRFGDRWVFRDALQAWIKGDGLIEQLQDQGEHLHRQINAQASPAEIQATVQEVVLINEALTRTERQFSASLGEASRLTQTLLMGSVLLVATVLSIGVVFLARRALNRHKGYERALRAANERWQLAASVAELGLFEMDLDARHVELDARAAAQHGLTPVAQRLPLETLQALVAKEEWDAIRHHLGQAVRAREVFKRTSTLRRPDGVSRQIEVTARLVDTDPGQRRLVGVFRDVTEERAQARMAMQKDAADKVAQAQREFLSRLSHELRTPLNAILGFAQLLMMDSTRPMAPSQHQQVGWILGAGKQLLALVEDVLDLTKVEAGEVSLALQPVLLGPVIQSSLALLESSCQRAGVRITDHLSAQDLCVSADPHRLAQVLLNLLSNGCKYNRPGGHVIIDGRRVDDQVVIEISDNGIGMSPEECAQLFQPFKRVATTPHFIEGSGLGLYIVKQLTERMHGSVSVSSVKDEGSQFTGKLPASHCPEMPPLG